VRRDGPRGSARWLVSRRSPLRSRNRVGMRLRTGLGCRGMARVEGRQHPHGSNHLATREAARAASASTRWLPGGASCRSEERVAPERGSMMSSVRITDQVSDRSPRLTSEQELANARSGRCRCGCPSTRSGWFGWRRCIWSNGIEFRVRRGRVQYRERPPFTPSLREWNDAKSRSGLFDDRQLHALLSFLTGDQPVESDHRRGGRP
jgi:hypothetical protein